jgi:hypothetical protein
VLLRDSGKDLAPHWSQVSLKLIAGKPRFLIAPPGLVGDDLVAFVEQRLATAVTADPSTTLLRSSDRDDKGRLVTHR